jgi:8-oxo-dGTP pyrophosphatase MutT (NUDIX family)
MSVHISSGAIVYKKDNGVVKVLLLFRNRTNSWHLPKGTQNPGETLEQTALREIKEETGVDVKLIEHIGKLDSTYDRDNVLIKKETHYFLAIPINENLNEHDGEHDLISYLDFDKALSNLESFSLFEKEGEILRKAKPLLV